MEAQAREASTLRHLQRARSTSAQNQSEAPSRKRAGAEPGPQTEPGEGWSRRKWMTLAILCGALFLDAMDVSSVNIALPTIGSHLHMAASSLQWVMSGYALAYGGFLLLGGRVSDLVDRRKVLFAALALFAIASAVGGLADSGTVLVASRFAKGIAAAFTVPAGLSILTTTFTTDADRHRALGAYAATAAAGFALGLVIGGLLAEAGWRYVFLVPAPITALILLAAARVIEPSPSAATGKKRYDLPGAITVTAAMLLLVYSVVEAPNHGWGSARTLGGFGLSVALAGLFFVIERRSPAPLVRLGILRVGSLVSANAGAFVYFGTYLGFQFLGTLYIQEVAGWSPVTTALAFLPASTLLPVLGGQAPNLIARFGTAKLVAAGLVLFAGAYALLLNDQTSHLTYVTLLLPTMLLSGISWGIAFPALNVQATAGVAHHEQGLAAGMFNTSFQIGGALGVAVISTVISSHTVAGAHPAAAILHSIRPAVEILAPAAAVGALAVLGLARIGSSPRQAQAGAAAGAPRPDEALSAIS